MHEILLMDDNIEILMPHKYFYLNSRINLTKVLQSEAENRTPIIDLFLMKWCKKGYEQVVFNLIKLKSSTRYCLKDHATEGQYLQGSLSLHLSMRIPDLHS